MKKFRRLILLRAFLLFVALTFFAWLLFKDEYLYSILFFPLCVWLMWFTIRSQIRTYRELQDFAEAARYRDFTRHFSLAHASVEVKPLRSAFNDINDVFKSISSDRETQHQYLQKIMELVDTAIISYEEKSGKVMWMNDYFKKLFNIPYISTIYALQKKNPLLFTKLSERSEERRVGKACRCRSNR